MHSIWSAQGLFRDGHVERFVLQEDTLVICDSLNIEECRSWYKVRDGTNRESEQNTPIVSKKVHYSTEIQDITGVLEQCVPSARLFNEKWG